MTDFNERASKGQAFNLAMSHALRDNKEEDMREVFSLFVKYYELGQVLQSKSVGDIKAALKCDNE